MLITFVLLLLHITHSEIYTRQSCNNNQIFNAFTLVCMDCPNNMRPNPKQKIPTSCICNKGYYPTSSNTCALFGPTPCPNNNQYYPVIQQSGSFISQSSFGTVSCNTCDSNSYPNINGTSCIRCPRNKKFSTSEGICICLNTSLIDTQKGCFAQVQTASTNNIPISSSKYSSHLKYLFPSCGYFKDLLSCSYLVNLCTYSMGYGDASKQGECSFFTTLTEFQYYHFFDNRAGQFYFGPKKFSKNQELSIKILYYLASGNFVKQKVMSLPDIFRCGMPANNSIQIKIGSNIKVSCSFNFDYLVQQAQSNTYQKYLYEMFLLGENNAYFQVPVYLAGSQIPIKRFYLEDVFTSSTYINILNGLKFSLSLNSSGYLTTPKLEITYKKLSIQNDKITPSTDKYQSISYDIKFIYDLTTFWPAFIGILITVNVLVLIQSIARTYIGHLNKQPIIGFFFYFGSFWSIWMFYFLLGFSGYWFIFCKISQDVYIFIPDSSTDPFYIAFFVIAGIMGLFRIITVLIDKRDKLNYQTFIINWEKSKNSWRQIFIVNSLAEFYTHRTISFFWLIMTLLFFMIGLKWEELAAEVAHTTPSSIFYFNPSNLVNLYFLCSSVFLVIGFVFKILRRISVFKWPYPFEDFVDYLNVANISLFFMKKRSEQAYFIRASIPDRVQVGFKDINDAIRKGLTKNRDLFREYSFHPDQRMYTIYVCKELQDKFNQMVKIEQQEDNSLQIKHNRIETKVRKGLSTRQDFIQNKLKNHLQQLGHIKQRSAFKRFLGIPQIDLRDQNVTKNKNEVIYDENMDLVSSVFPNGNQFEQIHTLIIIFLMFLLMTANVSAAGILSYFLSTYIIDYWVSSSCRSRLEKMTSVKQGFML